MILGVKCKETVNSGASEMEVALYKLFKVSPCVGVQMCVQTLILYVDLTATITWGFSSVVRLTDKGKTVPYPASMAANRRRVSRMG